MMYVLLQIVQLESLSEILDRLPSKLTYGLLFIFLQGSVLCIAAVTPQISCQGFHHQVYKSCDFSNYFIKSKSSLIFISSKASTVYLKKIWQNTFDLQNIHVAIIFCNNLCHSARLFTLASFGGG